MITKIWDKKESINGISASEILESRKDLANEQEVILLINDYNNHVDEIALGSTLRGLLKLESTKTTQEVIDAYITHKEYEANLSEADIQQAKNNAEKIATLEKEKSVLQTALAERIEQQAKDKLELQTSMAELIESMNIGGTV